MIDMTQTIIAKSDQLNADDLIGSNRTIKITKVSKCNDPKQPIAINFEGDDTKPYKPCKSMRRVLVSIWGPDGSQYVGRSMMLYRDPGVQYGGVAVGGIRISHMSHIDKAVTMALTETRANRKPFTVKPLKDTAPQQPQQPQAEAPGNDRKRAAAEQATLDLVARCKNAPGSDALTAIMSDPKTVTMRDRLREGYPDLSELFESTWTEKAAAFAAAPADEPF